MVHVKLYGPLRKLASQPEVEVAVEQGATLGTVLQRVCGDGSCLSSGKVSTIGGKVSTIMLNGSNCAFRQGLDTPVQDGDLIELLPIVSGG